MCKHIAEIVLQLILMVTATGADALPAHPATRRRRQKSNDLRDLLRPASSLLNKRSLQLRLYNARSDLIQHLRLHWPWVHGVDSRTIFTQLRRPNSSEALHSSLAGRVGTHTW